MPLPFTHDRRPAFAEQDQRTWANHAGLNLIPHQRQLGDSSHSAADCNKTNRPLNQSLKSFIKMWSSNFVGVVSIWFGHKLINDEPQPPSPALVRPAACNPHHTKSPSGANCESGISQEFTSAFCLRV